MARACFPSKVYQLPRTLLLMRDCGYGQWIFEGQRPLEALPTRNNKGSFASKFYGASVSSQLRTQSNSRQKVKDGSLVRPYQLAWPSVTAERLGYEDSSEMIRRITSSGTLMAKHTKARSSLLVPFFLFGHPVRSRLFRRTPGIGDDQRVDSNPCE